MRYVETFASFISTYSSKIDALALPLSTGREEPKFCLDFDRIFFSPSADSQIAHNTSAQPFGFWVVKLSPAPHERAWYSAYAQSATDRP